MVQQRLINAYTPFIFSFPKRTNLKAYARSQATQQLHFIRTLSHGHTARGQTTATARRFPDSITPQGCILPYSYSSSTLSLSLFPTQWAALSVQSATLRGYFSSKDFHQVPGSGSSQKGRNTYFPLSRQLSHQKLKLNTVSSRHPASYQPAAQTAVYSQHTKVSPAPVANSAYPRCNSQFSYSQSLSQSRKSAKVHRNITSFSTTSSTHSNGSDMVVRHGVFLQSHITTCSSTYESPSAHSAISMVSNGGTYTRSSVGSASDSSLSAVVEQQQLVARPAFQSPNSASPHYHRCIPSGMGSKYARSHSSRSKDSSSNTSSHQPSRASSNSASSQSLSQSPTLEDSTNPHRQYDCKAYSKMGWDTHHSYPSYQSKSGTGQSITKSTS